MYLINLWFNKNSNISSPNRYGRDRLVNYDLRFDIMTAPFGLGNNLIHWSWFTNLPYRNDLARKYCLNLDQSLLSKVLLTFHKMTLYMGLEWVRLIFVLIWNFKKKNEVSVHFWTSNQIICDGRNWWKDHTIQDT